MPTKKLIEVALPLDKINAEAAREKSIRHGHPSTLHLWWARRPLAAARAVIWASLVDDPSSHQELFPTEEDQNRERQRLFRILENLVVWENSNNEEVLSAAKAEIMKYTDGNLPALLDPFAGGGAIPLEAQRLGLEAHAHDLNPVAVMINKAMIEIPPRFANKPPVNPDAQGRLDYAEGWHRAQGLAEDVRYYGEWMKQEAFKHIGHLYPKVEVPQEQGGGEATVIAWIWTRTVKCPNPACGCQMPLASSFVLSKKGKSLTCVQPIINGQKINYEIHYGNVPPQAPKSSHGVNFRCLFCGENATGNYVRKEAVSQRLGCELMAIVAEGRNGRIFLPPNVFHSVAANEASPKWKPDQLVTTPCHDVDRLPMYGMPTWGDAFTPRQLSALTTFSDLVAAAQSNAELDAISAGMPDDHIPLRENGRGARAYGEAVGIYLSLVVDRLADRGSSICSWDSGYTKIRNTFGRQAIPMTWDYAEGNPFSSSTGCFSSMVEWVFKCLWEVPASPNAEASQADAQSDCGLRNIMVSTDPPYYDNIGYADLSDFFYVWMRQSLKDIYPALFSTMLVPKAEELIATPYRHGGSLEKAKNYFENGMLLACKQIYKYAQEDVPVTIYYAYKQSDSDDKGTASSGWETMLGAIVNAGFSITGTWPMRTEMANRTIASGTNALASSIVLVCRKRPVDAPICPRRSLIAELRRELRPALQKLQRSNIAPVDLAQSAIGPGMAVFSKYSKVLEADGTPMSVRSALQVINQELDVYFNEQDGDLDRDSRFCVDLYTQFAFNDIKFGDADTLARAKNTSVSAMASAGIVYAQKGLVHLLGRDEVPQDVQKNKKICWLLTQQLTHTVLTDGVPKCAKLVASILGSDAESAKDLAYRLFTIADRKGWTQEAYAYNALVTSWPEIQAQVAELQAANGEQLTLFE